MTVQIETNPIVARRRRSLWRARPGFTLTELLVVIAIIVLLVGLLLAALNQVQAKSRETSTKATMQAFINACDVFAQEHGFYPGVVPEEVLAFSPLISGTENAVLHLVGGYVREVDDPANYVNFTTADGWEEIAFPLNGGGNYLIKVNRFRFGDGPIINGKTYPAYFAPDSDNFASTSGQNPDTLSLPDVIDAWGQPLAMVRQQRSVGLLVDDGSGAPFQFSPATLGPYTNSTALGKRGRDQTTLSILNRSSDIPATVARLLEHPSIAGQARGKVMLMSAGADGVFLAVNDGPGTPDMEVLDIFDPAIYPARVLDEYDDLILYGGS